jgi:hypothetical protein
MSRIVESHISDITGVWKWTSNVRWCAKYEISRDSENNADVRILFSYKCGRNCSVGLMPHESAQPVFSGRPLFTVPYEITHRVPWGGADFTLRYQELSAWMNDKKHQERLNSDLVKLSWYIRRTFRTLLNYFGFSYIKLWFVIRFETFYAYFAFREVWKIVVYCNLP